MTIIVGSIFSEYPLFDPGSVFSGLISLLDTAFLGLFIGFFRFMGGFSVLKGPFLSMYR
jgi:hypothetical protein